MKSLINILQSPLFWTLVVLGSVSARLIWLNRGEKSKPKSKPAAENTTKTKEGGVASKPGVTKEVLKWLWRLAILVAVSFGVRACVQHQEKGQAAEIARLKVAVVEAAQTKSTNQWVFIWELPPGQFDGRGSNGEIMDAEITQRDSTSLYFNAKYGYLGGIEVSRFQLVDYGDKLIGTWSQDRPYDGGTVFMTEIVKDQIWSGQYTDRSGIYIGCTLKKK